MQKMWMLALPVAGLAQCAPECAPPPAPPAAESQPAMTNVGRWDRIARCESGGRWDYPPVTNSSGTYSGGLMIGHKWWGPNGGKQYAEWPYLATKAEQIAVAETIWRANGPAAWDCA